MCKKEFLDVVFHLFTNDRKDYHRKHLASKCDSVKLYRFASVLVTNRTLFQNGRDNRRLTFS